MPRKVNLIPMAGEGQRFIDAGYKIPKPLVSIADEPMIVRAARSLPKSDKWIFICRDHHIKQSAIDKILCDYFHGAEVIGIKNLTEGQASTCLLAEDTLTEDDILTIGACDNSMTYDHDKFEKLMQDDTVDAIIWTFRSNPAVLQNPKMYGWVVVEDGNIVRKISCKIPVSDSPIKDHAIIGTFTFKKAADFVSCSKAMIKANRRVNNEFYVDEVMNVAVETGLKVVVFEVDRYICWGTPQDLEIYNYWRSYFKVAGF